MGGGGGGVGGWVGGWVGGSPVARSYNNVSLWCVHTRLKMTDGEWGLSLSPENDIKPPKRPDKEPPVAPAY